MALHPPKQETAVVTPAGAAAANELERIEVANNFDPIVTGLAHTRADAWAITVDKSKCWQAFGLGDHDWEQRDGGLALTTKGAMAVRGANGLVELLPGANNTLLVADSTKPEGLSYVPMSAIFQAEHVWYAMATWALDFADGFCQRIVLASGANAFTGMVNAIPGVAYKLKLIQPASGAAGTITFTPTAPNVVKVAGSLNLSPTNGKSNYVFITYDDAGNGEFSVFVSAEF